MNKRLIYGMSQGGLRGQGSYMSIFTNTTPKERTEKFYGRSDCDSRLFQSKSTEDYPPWRLRLSGTSLIEWTSKHDPVAGRTGDVYQVNVIGSAISARVKRMASKESQDLQ